MTTLAVFVPALMAVGILVSGAIVVADWISGLLPSRAIRRRQQVTREALGTVARIAETVDADMGPLPLRTRVERPRRVYVVMALSFAGVGLLAAHFGEDLYSEPLGWLHDNPWTLGIGYGIGGLLVALAIISLIPAFVSLQSGRVVRALVERTWLGRPANPPRDPRLLVGRRRSLR